MKNEEDKMVYEVPRLELIDMPFVLKGDGEPPHSQAVPDPYEDIEF